MENHDQAFYVWRDAGVKQRVLVHIDAHHDMWWIQDQTAISIANFICPALRQDLVREIFWVVPDATFENARTRKPILRHLKKLLKTYPTASRSVIEEEHRITASVLGKTLTVCPLRELPDLRENVLLDIDVDYLVIPRVSYGGADRRAPPGKPQRIGRDVRAHDSPFVPVGGTKESHSCTRRSTGQARFFALRLTPPIARAIPVSPAGSRRARGRAPGCARAARAARPGRELDRA